ncbi:MAG: PEGA domain-containing protein [Archangium sp.]|nr:PEGA domain-containing protein [Archangium sp.]
MAHTVASSPHGSLRSGPSGVLRMEPPPQPVPAARPSLGSGIRQPSAVSLPPVSSPSGIGLPKTSSQPYVPRMAPPEAMGVAPAAEEAPPSSRRGLLVGVAGAVVLGLVGAGYFATSRKGLLMLDLPVKVGGKARVNVNGKDLTEADGSLIRDWPQIREVPAGKVTVMIVAPGYETFTEVVEVKEGNEYTSLTKKLKEQKPEAPAPAPDIAPPPTAPP